MYYACKGPAGTDFHIVDDATGEDCVHTFDRSMWVDTGNLFAFAYQGRVIYCYDDLLEAEGTQVLRRIRMPGSVQRYLLYSHMLIVDCGRLAGIDLDTFTMDVDLAALTLQESEVQAVKWASEEEILAMLADGRFIPYHRAFIQLIFALKDSRGAHVSKMG